MSRNEQILLEVQKRFSNDKTHIVSKINAFIDGAQWADEHPKPEMVNKQEFIEKARKWIEKNFKSDGYFSLYYLGGRPYTPENIAKDFCKTMEE